MHSIVAESSHVQIGQAGPIAVRPRPADPPTRKGPGGGPWVNRVPLGFLDARKNEGIGHRLGWMLLVLEGYCRDKAYCWVSNAELAEAFGCDRSTLNRLLRDMVVANLIHRVPTAEGRQGREGIILRKRANPDLPTAGDPAAIADVIALMRGAKTRPSGGQKRAPRWGAETRPGIKTLSFEEGRIEVGPPNPRGDFSLSTNDNDPDPDADPAPQALVTGPAEAIGEGPASEPAEAEGVPGGREDWSPEVCDHIQAFVAGVEEPIPSPRAAAYVSGLAGQLGRAADPPRAAVVSPVAFPRPKAPPIADRRKAAPADLVEESGPTAGQRAWLDTLTAEQRAEYDAKSPAARAVLLAPHRDGLNACPIIAADQARTLAPRVPVVVDPPMPMTLEGMWEELRGAPATWPPRLAEMMCRHFGVDENRRYWRAFQAIADAVWRGEFPASSVLDALRQSAKPEVKNPGAVFNYALQRDHDWRWEEP